MLALADIIAARKKIAATVIRTPLVPSPYLTRLVGQDVLLKLEITQPIGAFKLRGAASAISSLPDDTVGVTCCSTGNHGRGVAYAANARCIPAVICMSSLVPQTKIDGIVALGGEVKIVGDSQDDALAESQRLCAIDGLTEISPFDDYHVVSGQGTIGLELIEDGPDLQMILVPLSGGGLAGGVAVAAKAANPKVRVIGISMNRGAAMHASLEAGKPVEVEEVPSLADSLGGGVGALRIHMLEDHPVHSKGRIPVAPGQIVRLIEAGGGGFGDPAKRDRMAIAADIENGFVSREAAARYYGYRE